MSTQADAQKQQQRDILAHLAEEGRLTKEQVLAEAKLPNSPLHNHPAFDGWNTRAASEKHWLAQARRVIQEFKRDYRIEKGRVLDIPAGNLTVTRGRTVTLREFYPVRVGAELPSGTEREDEADAGEDEERPKDVPQQFVAVADFDDDRELKVQAAATFFRTLRGFRGQCYLYEDLDPDFGVIAKAIDRISGRLEDGKFAAETAQDVPLPTLAKPARQRAATTPPPPPV